MSQDIILNLSNFKAHELPMGFSCLFLSSMGIIINDKWVIGSCKQQVKLMLLLFVGEKKNRPQRGPTIHEPTSITYINQGVLIISYLLV